MAVTLTLAALASELRVDLEDRHGTRLEPDYSALTRLLAVATALVDRYAPGAPDAIANEAAVRFCAYSRGAEASAWGAWRRAELRGLDVEHTASHASAWRNCGAAALLAPWKVRGVGVLG